MADVVTTKVLHSGTKRHVAVFTNASDGTGEAAVAKVDISGLDGAPTVTAIDRVQYSCSGMAVKVGFDHTADDFVLVLQGDGEIDFSRYGGLTDPASAGGTGDIVFTTLGATANDSYTILLDLKLK